MCVTILIRNASMLCDSLRYRIMKGNLRANVVRITLVHAATVMAVVCGHCSAVELQRRSRSKSQWKLTVCLRTQTGQFVSVGL